MQNLVEDKSTVVTTLPEQHKIEAVSAQKYTFLLVVAISDVVLCLSLTSKKGEREERGPMS